jgi:hypothetical protein
MLASPLLDPEVEYVVQVYIGEHRADTAPLNREMGSGLSN